MLTLINVINSINNNPYNSLKLFRQSKFNDWDEIINEIYDQLKTKLIKNKYTIRLCLLWNIAVIILGKIVTCIIFKKLLFLTIIK